MPNAVLLDTSTLPVWRGLDGPLWLSVRKLSEVASMAIYIPDLVVHESINLRVEKFTEAATEFVDAYNKIEKFFDIDPIYVPDVSEVGDKWEAELRAAFKVIDVDGADAAEALLREARRTRPARRGRGGRDSAIWMTALRLAKTHDTVYFVSSNKADFSVGKEGLLHPALIADAVNYSAQINYLTSIYGLIEALASEIETPALDPALVGGVLNAELREHVLADALDDPRYGDVTAAEVSLEGVEATQVTVKKAFAIGERHLALVMGTGALTIGHPDDRRLIAFTFAAWLDFDAEGATALAGEVESITLI